MAAGTVKQIDFTALYPVVLELDTLRFKSLLEVFDVNRLRMLQQQFNLMTNGRQLPPRRFVTDGCSMSTDAFGRECCELHDLAYWLGGTRAERLAADRRLRDCTCDHSRIYAPIQYAGVRLGGHPYAPDFLLNLMFRWGFGWGYPFPGEAGIVY